ncbi:Dynactin subunit 4, partial [Fragariocoptes setiger]
PPEYRPLRHGGAHVDGANNQESYNPYKLEHIFFPAHVLYQCSCGAYKRLYNMYFCRHCMAMRCRDCVSHEMDTQYCQHCLEYIPTIDPKFQKNKCATCYHCPSCQHLLSVTTLSVTQPLDDTSGEPTRKSCVLTCAFCRWTSDIFNVFESSKVTNDLPDTQLLQSKRIDQVFDHYHALASREKNEREKRRVHPRSGNAMHLLEKYGISSSLSPKLTASLRAKSYQTSKLTSPSNKSNPTSPSVNLDKSTEKAISEFVGPVASEEPQGYEELDAEFYYNRDFDLDAVSSIEQRLAQIELQPTRVDKFRPISKSLSVKRSLRCKVCEHNLCKSEFSPVSIKFKIQLSAFYHIPELRISPRGDHAQLKVNKFNLVELTIQNQTSNSLNVEFNSIEQAEDDSDVSDAHEIVLPPKPIQLKPKDETADIEHAPIGAPPVDEEAQIMFVRAHKVGIFIRVKPLAITHNLIIKFLMRHDIVVLQGPQWRVNNSRCPEEVIHLWYSSRNLDKQLGEEKWTVLEQVCMAAIDLHDEDITEYCLDQLDKQFPGSNRVNILRIMGRYERKGLYDKALRLYNDMISSDETNTAVHKRKIAMLISQRRIVDAIKSLCEYLKIFLNDQEAWKELCYLYMLEQDYHKAIFCMEELILSNPHSHTHLEQLAQIHYTMGTLESYDLARSYYCQALKLNPTNMRALFGLYSVTSNLSTMSKASQQLRKDCEKLNDWAKKSIANLYETRANNFRYYPR